MSSTADTLRRGYALLSDPTWDGQEPARNGCPCCGARALCPFGAFLCAAARMGAELDRDVLYSVLARAEAIARAAP